MKNYIIIASLVVSSMHCAQKAESLDTPPAYATWLPSETCTTFQALKEKNVSVGKEVNSINRVLGCNPKVWKAIMSHKNRLIEPSRQVTLEPKICAHITPLPYFRRIANIGVSQLYYINNETNNLDPIKNATTFAYSDNVKYAAWAGLAAASLYTAYRFTK